MNTADIESIAALYLPLAAALLIGLTQRRLPRQFPACLLSLLWTLTTLPILVRINQLAHWWSFPTSSPRFCGMPLELYFGWAVLWGILPQLAFPRLRLRYVAIIMAAFDLIAMPALIAIIHLEKHWLIGESAAILFVLLPALAIARWTREDIRLFPRATLQIAISGMLFLFVIPELAFALRPGHKHGWQPFLEMPSWQRQAMLQLLILLALPGIAAVVEFAQRGRGTPIPYDPPKRLVTSGIYRYCSNPMQLSCAAVMLLWSAILRNPWLTLAAALSIIYSAGIAAWDEHQDLALRFGAEWQSYRTSVHDWRLRWRPYHRGASNGTNAQLFIASTCEPCSQLQRWLVRRSPLGLALCDASALPPGSILRLRYNPNDGSPSVEGVRALGRALEHIHLAWALAGAALRLPLVWQFVQLLMDASGLGPRIPDQLDHPSCDPRIRPSRATAK